MNIYEDQQVIPLAVYSGAGPVDSAWQRAEGATGLLVVLYAKVAGTSTLAVRLVGREPFENTEFIVNVDKTIATASRFIWVFHPGIAAQPPGEAAVTTQTPIVQLVSVPIPEQFLLRVVKGDVSAWTLAVSMRRIP